MLMSRWINGFAGEARLAPAPGRATSFFEYWPGWLFYTPVVLHWIALGLRYRSLTLPTAANPAITAGGLCGESKSAILDLVGGRERELVAPYAAFDAGAAPETDIAAAAAAMEQAGLSYPVVVKPDIGCNGTGVRKLSGPADLERYLTDLPRPLPFARVRFLLQAFIPEIGEAGLFYVRLPGEAQGRVTSITLKSAPAVAGDGRSSLRSLILADPRYTRLAKLFLPRLGEAADRVPASGEQVQLAFVGNHCKGSVFRDGRDHLSPQLTERVERFAQAIPGFSFGRIDLRFRSLAELHRGHGIRVMEVNGVGSEATHIWDPDTTLRHAYAAQFAHYGAAFRIGAANRARGAKPTPLAALGRLWRLQRRLLRSYPAND